MDAHITITTGGFIDSQPRIARPVIINQVYKNAKKYGWDIRVGGQAWGQAK